MAEVLVVTGTGTGVGKTVVTAALAADALRAGRSVCVVKPVQTGVSGAEPGDLHEVQRLVAPVGRPALVEPLRLPAAMAPQAAAARAAATLPSLRDHVTTILAAAAGQDLVVVEGAGGVLVRLDGTGPEGGTIADLARLLDAELVVATGPGLGTLNVTELTVEAAARRGATVRGVVVTPWPSHPDEVETQNLQDLPRLSGVPLLGVVPELAGHAVPTVTRPRPRP